MKEANGTIKGCMLNLGKERLRRCGMGEIRRSLEGNDRFLKIHDGSATLEAEPGVHKTTYSTSVVVWVKY